MKEEMKKSTLKLAGRMARAYRKESGLTMKKAGEIYGWSESAVSRFENGEIDSLVYYLFALWGFNPVKFYFYKDMVEAIEKKGDVDNGGEEEIVIGD